MKASPTARSLAYCRSKGWHAGVVEKWNPHAKVRHDLFGCIDIVAVMVIPDGPLDEIECPGEMIRGHSELVGIQACAGASHAARVAKVKAAPVLPHWIAAGGGIEVWSWSKQGPRGKRKVWSLRRERVTP